MDAQKRRGEGEVSHYIGCEKIKRLIGEPNLSCCGSCHGDEDDDMCWIYLGKDREAEVCCTVRMAFSEWENRRIKLINGL